MFKNKFYISTTLPYLSGEINKAGHIGHAFEFVLTDVITRYYRYKFGNDNVFFNTGVDEHGQKIYLKAIELNKTPQEYCDEKTILWKEFCTKFRISYDNFYRTTSLEHKKKAIKFFNDIKNKLYLSKYTAIYCDGCESFKTTKEIINGKCEQHPTLELKEISEENYFFKLKEFAQQYNPKDILVDHSLNNELNNLIKNSEDISVSRENVSWAIPIPNTNQTIYLWLEALGNYHFALSSESAIIKSNFNSQEFWNNSIIICGKDNLRFQALILPAILDANKIPPPHKVLVHGTIQDANGQKMSKTTGNVIDPIKQLEKFGLNAVRYYLIAGLNTFGNSSYSEEELVNKYNNDIVNGYGNLMARALHLIDIKNIEIDENHVRDTIRHSLNDIRTSFETFDLKITYSKIAEQISLANKYITEEKPFSDTCKNPTQILNDVYYLLKNISPYFQFVMPDKAKEIDEAFELKKKAILFKRIEKKETI